VKELRLGYRTDHGDIERQITKAREFLEEGDRVKFLLRFRGREMAYQHLGREKLLGVCDALKDVAIAEGTPRMEGRMMGILLAPGKKRSTKPPVKGAAKSTAAKSVAPEDQPEKAEKAEANPAAS
jgi:translation initiation factor IF-3